MPEPATVDQLVRLRAAHDGSKPMVIDATGRISYCELETTTADLAAVFIEAGVGKGTRVGLIMPNSARWVQIAIALTRIGAVLVPLSTLLRAASVQFLLTVHDFRGHHYLDDLRSALGCPDLGDAALRHPELPALRRVWTADRLAGATAGERARRIVGPMTGTVT